MIKIKLYRAQGLTFWDKIIKILDLDYHHQDPQRLLCLAPPFAFLLQRGPSELATVGCSEPQHGNCHRY
ncbi:hypothetical protein LENED_001994 [Lentinula edodes]|uniref:Uncharacterized protein n=1 Tax=Lentinula edodes TaxID=5353 RepID=A0A1Q3DZY8_LENED|nr:hypothetical protein LENED_001994 [Lentinula edodes]